MTRERAISLLLGSAHPLPAETDSEWEAAALMLDSDETLAAWFAVQSPADEAVKSVLRRLPVPAPTTVLPSPFSRPGVTRRRWLGVASTGLAASLAAGWWVLERPTHFAHADGSGDFAGFREDMARFADRLFRLTKKDSQFATLNQWLDQMQAARPDMEVLPPSISGRGQQR